MQYSAGILRLNRRASQRADAQVRITFTVAGCVSDALTLDLSETGARIRTEVQLERGFTLVLYLDPQPGRHSPPIEAQVVWTRQVSPEAFWCGLQFRTLPDSERERLREMIATANSDQDIPEIPSNEITALESMEAVPAPNAQAAPFPFASQSTSSEYEAALRHDQVRRQADIALAQELVIQGKKAAAGGQLEVAKRVLEEAVRRMPDCVEAVEELARVVYLMGDYAGSATLFDKALRIRYEQR